MPEGRREGYYTVATADGRTVLIRPCLNGEAVQLAIMGKRGGMVEAVSFDAVQLPAVIAALGRAGRTAESDLMGALKEREAELEERYAAALARNPWLQAEREKRGLV